jgi:hypothetical protein
MYFQDICYGQCLKVIFKYDVQWWDLRITFNDKIQGNSLMLLIMVMFNFMV